MKSAPRLAVIGCGAIAERFHAPALAKQPALLPGLVLVDPDAGRAQSLSSACGGGSVATDLASVTGTIDGAIVTAPHALHHRIITQLLQAGVPVLSEKPLAGTFAEASELVVLAEQRGVPLAVNNTRRLYPSHRRVRELVEAGSLGALRRVTFEDGAKFDWPLASPSLFGAASGGRGILLDIGAHVVDLLCWWLGATPEVAQYGDDSRGGTEAYVELGLSFSRVPATVRLSWLDNLRNTFSLEGERATVSGAIYDWNNLTVRENGRSTVLKLPGAIDAYPKFAEELLRNFCDVVSAGARPLVTGADVLPSLATIDACYARRTRLEMPWYDAWTRVVPA